MNERWRFDEIYRRHANAIFRVCMRAVSRREVAEEITGAVFLALHERWDTLSEGQMPEWLFGVARQGGEEYWRHHSDEERWQTAASPRPEPEYKLDALLERCPNLKPIHRVCSVLRFAHGLSRAQIAEATRLTEIQVKGHLQFALQLLRQQVTGAAKSVTASRDVEDDEAIEQEFQARTGGVMLCPPLEMLLAAGQGVFQPEIEQEVSAHMESCGLCRMLVKDFTALPEAELNVVEIARIRAKIPRDQELPVARMRYRAALATAAMLLVALSGTTAYRIAHPPAILMPLMPGMQPPPNVVPLEKLAPPELGAGRLVRARAKVREPSARALSPAFEAYNGGEYGRAENAFSALVRKYPKSDVPPLYLGVTQLMLEHNEDAVVSLDRAMRLATPPRSEAAAWYRTIAAQRVKDAGAAAMFVRICERGGTYSARACRMANEAKP